MSNNDGFIGVFDSGVGGTSVLGECVWALPSEHFVYYGDSAHAPYGDKTPEQVRELSCDIAQSFVEQGAKALVIACNTATSCAADTLRAMWPDMPIVGVEPALKPAAECRQHKSILVMATPTTLKLPKFRMLMEKYSQGSEVIPLACPGLANRIEQGNLDASDMGLLVDSFVGKYRGRVDAVVLGCTHYPFIKKHIAHSLGDVSFYDGGRGVAHQLSTVLERAGLARAAGNGTTVFRSSDEDSSRLELYQELFDRALLLASEQT